MNTRTVHPIALLNGPVMTSDGLFRMEKISQEDADQLIRQHGFISAIGHRSTAEMMAEIFRQPISMSRIDFHQEAGQLALIFKLNRRPPEGAILTRGEIEAIGYSFKLLTRIE